MGEGARGDGDKGVRGQGSNWTRGMGTRGNGCNRGASLRDRSV